MTPGLWCAEIDLLCSGADRLGNWLDRLALGDKARALVFKSVISGAIGIPMVGVYILMNILASPFRLIGVKHG